jgi:capsular polysaccharide biosynthesis protein
MGPTSCAWLNATEIEASVPFTYAADMLLGENLRDAEKRCEFGPRHSTNRAVNWRMRDVTLVPAQSLVFKDGNMLEQTRYGLHPSQEKAAFESLARPHGRLDKRRAFVGFNQFFNNYFHLLTQIVPAIAGYQEEPDFRDGVLLLGAQTPILRRALELAGVGVPEIVVLRTMPPIDIVDLTFSSILTTDGENPSLLSRLVFDRMIESTTRPPGGFATMIYVWRADSKMRPMRNEAELVERLIRHGVEPVVLSGLSLDEQIAVFRNARLIIGPHGAGLTNLVFGTPGAVVYELLPDHYLNPCVNRLAQLRGLHYWCDVHRAEPRLGLWYHHTPWTVDIDRVERRLREILSIYTVASRCV